MRLIELELNNIKSYQQEIIKFSDGINCILGLNGSGKSTIIESIGTVLFNFSQKTNNNLLRYNENKGMIALSFIGNDDKKYKIVRTIRAKGSGSIKIIDCENEQVLHETVSDVYEFVKKILNVPKEKNLSKMFEEIIAVPQGFFVNAFLESPRSRKENFDKLFELDIYKKLADEMKALSDKIQKEYIYDLEKKIAQIEGKLTNYQNICDEEKQINDQINRFTNQLQIINNIYNKKVIEKQQFESIQKQLEDSNSKKKEYGLNIKNIEEQLKLNKEALKKSLEAATIVKQNEFGYNLYLKTNKTLKLNESKYEKYLEYDLKIKDNNTNIQLTKESNSLLAKMIHDLKVQFGINKQTVIDKQKDIEEKQEETKKLEKEIGPIREELKKESFEITNKQATFTFYIDKLKTINEYLLSNQPSNISDENDNKVLEIDRQLLIINENKKKILDLEKEKARISSDLDNLQTNYDYISDGCCPILKQKCLNIKGASLSLQVDGMIKEQQQQLIKVNSQINNLMHDVQIEQQLLKERDYILIEKNNKERNYERYKAVIEDLYNSFKDDLKDNIECDNQKIVQSLIRKYENLKETYVNLKYETLKQEEIRMSNTIYSNLQQSLLIKKSINEINDKNLSFEKEIREKEEQFHKNEFLLMKKQQENETIQELIHEYKDIKKTIEDNKGVLLKYQSNYELYIAKRDEANNMPKYEKLVNENELKIKDLNVGLREVNLQIMGLEKLYNEEEMSSLTVEINKMVNEISVLNTTISLNTERVLKIREQIAEFESLFNEKRGIEDDLNKYQNLDKEYKIIRDIFTNIPRELSKQIRKYISTYATSLYRKISCENVRIDLLDDYEVVIVDCVEESKVKKLSQLSGGEQMSVAISIRLAMLKQITNIEFYFMDEPTINLDFERRMMVAEVVKDVSSELKQLFVISHDDTFEAITDNTIKMVKKNNISVIEE